MVVQKTHPFVVIFFLTENIERDIMFFSILFESALRGIRGLLSDKSIKRHKHAYYMTDLFQCLRLKSVVYQL